MRRSGKLTGNDRLAPDVITTDLSVLREKITELTDMWDWEVADYSVGNSQLGLTEAQYAAYVYFRVISALAKFDAVYAASKSTIEQNYGLAPRLSGLTVGKLEEIDRGFEAGF